MELLPAHRRIAKKEAPETRIGKGFKHVAQPEVSVPVAFACKGQDGVGTSFDSAVNQASEVHAEEWKFGIWNRVDQVANKVRALGLQFVIFAAKRNDAR